MRTFFFSRFSLPEISSKEVDKIQLLYDRISVAPEIIYRKDHYRFMNVEIVKSGIKNYISGQIVKYKPNHEENVINKTNNIETLVIQNVILANVRFIIDPDLSLLINEENRNHVPASTFAERFKNIFEGEARDFQIVIAPITDDYDFIKRVEEIAEIKRIVIRLVPSNPSSADIWKPIDEKLNKDNITNYREVQENKKKGQGINIDDETKAKFFMSEDGYGKSTVRGLDAQGKQVVVTSEDSQKQAKTSIDNSIETPIDQIEMLQTKIRDIAVRTNETP